MLPSAIRALASAARRGGSRIPVGAAAFLSSSAVFPDPGLSHVVGPRDPPLVHDTLISSLRRTVERSPSAPAVISAAQGIALSYEQFLEQVEATACSLMALGVRRGDRVAVWASNCAEWPVLQQAVPLAGAIQVSLNPALREDELVHTLTICGVSAIILSPEFKGDSLIATLERAWRRAPALRLAVVLGDTVNVPSGPVFLRSSDLRSAGQSVVLGDTVDVPSGPGWLRWSDLRSAGQSAAARAAMRSLEATLRPTDPANIQFTSGTTGKPKAATLTHLNVVNNGLMIGHLLGYTPADRICLPVPLFHCFGQVLGNLAAVPHGSAVIYPGPGFNAAETLDAVTAHRCTSLYGTPTHFISMLEAYEGAKDSVGSSSLRTGIMAGAPCPAPIMRRVRDELGMRDVAICFGMTETSPVSFQTRRTDAEERRVCTVGQVHPHVEACVVDPESGNILERNTPGELWIRGYSVFGGYWGDQAATAATRDAAGWCHTGDLAVIDSEGYAQIVGRSKDVVIRGGENLFPREIEEFVHAHPAVADVQVFGVPDARMGEQLAAWAKLKPGAVAEGTTAESIKAWCVGRISRHKIPKYWKIVDSFPATVSGKPQKYIMRRLATEELGLVESAAAVAAGCPPAI